MSWITVATEFLAPGWVGSIIGIVSVVIALILYYKSRQRTNLSYSHWGDRLLGLATEGLPAEITVQYRGENIPRLTRSLVVFWNSGDKTLAKSDIVKADPLRLSIGNDGEILSISVLKTSRDVNEVLIKRSPHNDCDAYLSFEFLDARDGAVVEVLHTSEQRQPRFSGTLRGMPKGMKNLGKIPSTRSTRMKTPIRMSVRVLAWVTTVVGAAAIAVGVFTPADKLAEILSPRPEVGEVGASAITFAGALYAALGCILLFLVRRKHPKALHLEDLE